MARRTHKPDRLTQVLIELSGKFGHSPLSCVCDHIAKVAHHVRESIDAGFNGEQAAEALADAVGKLGAQLPDSFGDRFLFDSGMISGLVEEWSSDRVRVSETIVPKSSEIWGHQRLPLPSVDRNRIPVIDLVLIPSGAGPEGVDLLSYPFLCHELGHNILFRNLSRFDETFGAEVTQWVRSLQLRGIADKGAARTEFLRTVELLRGFWNPTADHRNWSHELAVDTIALWTCGPAYLAAIQDVLDDPTTNPYEISQSHPPYEVRATSLLGASERLGWAYYGGDLSVSIQRWRSSNWATERTNQYVALADAALVKNCADAALSVCQQLSLPMCTPERIQSVAEQLSIGTDPEFGVDVLIAAWLTRRARSEDEYALWEQDTFARLKTLITL